MPGPHWTYGSAGNLGVHCRRTSVVLAHPSLSETSKALPAGVTGATEEHALLQSHFWILTLIVTGRQSRFRRRGLRMHSGCRRQKSQIWLGAD